jgi:hypothetical protein
MNFEELRQSWANEPIEGAALPVALTAKTSSAISQVRRNMRNEFIWTLIGFGATLIFVLFYSKTRVSFLIVCAASFLVVQTVYYFWRFFLFYRRTAKYDMNLRKSIQRFVFELQLNMEVYKTYSFCVTPVACLLWIAIADAAGWTGFLQSFLCSGSALGARTVFWTVAVLLLAQIIGAFCLHFHLQTQYGRHLIQLKRVMSDLEGD